MLDIPEFVFLRAWLVARLDAARRDERGASTLEIVIWAAVLGATALAATGLVTGIIQGWIAKIPE